MSSMIPGLPPISPNAPTSPIMPSGASSQSGTFNNTLKSAMQQVDQLDRDSQMQVTQMLQGDRQDIHNVMIAVEKADIAFELMMQVRNKIVNAYQEVSKLQF
ncbi:MAG TPA: flagellar hook-basal body complex protein FliE [Terriglobales bacterium]|nr:flagellar hook-basal body complex protein FliE [Terriglobales bacterium]